MENNNPINPFDDHGNIGFPSEIKNVFSDIKTFDDQESIIDDSLKSIENEDIEEKEKFLDFIIKYFESNSIDVPEEFDSFKFVADANKKKALKDELKNIKKNLIEFEINVLTNKNKSTLVFSKGAIVISVGAAVLVASLTNPIALIGLLGAVVSSIVYIYKKKEIRKEAKRSVAENAKSHVDIIKPLEK